jgi:branched-chain amino acid transport system substrate-binding protein
MKFALLATAALFLGAASQTAQAEIVVGVGTALSGAVASIGIPNHKGIKAGFEYKGEINGEKIRMVVLDDGSDPSTAARNARKFVEQENVDIIIGTAGAPQTLAMATVAAELKVPMVAISPIAPPPVGEGGPWVVQTPQPMPLLVQGVVDHMAANGVKTVAFIGFADAFGDLLSGSLKAAADKAGIEVVTDERYARTDTTVAAQALKAVARKPDAVMIGGTATPGALPALALSDRRYTGKVYGNHGLISADFLRVAGEKANGIICPTGPVVVAEQLPDENPIKKVALDFRAAYQKANGEPVQDAFAPYAFDGWLVFADAATRALGTGAKPGTPEFKAALREALFTTKEMVGTHAVYNYTPESSLGVDERSRVLVTIDKGEYKLVQ